MSVYDEYRRRAQQAQEWVERAETETDRANWQRIVEGWLAMIPGGTPKDVRAFEALCRAKGTGQEESKAIH